MMYNIVKYSAYFLAVIFMRVRVTGRENVPKDGPVLICSNHISNFDPPLLATHIRRKVHFMAKSELFNKKILGFIMYFVGAFPVRRGVVDRKSLKQGIQFLNEGQVLCLFPEGTRSKSGEIGKGLTGAGFFALRSDAAVVPVAISGRYGLFRRVNVVIGRPVPMQDLRTNKAKAEEATEVIMEEIKAVHQQAKAGSTRLPSG